jgi:hypothetical protein
MNVKAVSINKRRVIWLSAFAAVFTLTALAGWRWMSVSNEDLTPTAHAQSSMLDQRINQIEQRFYYLETRLNNLESNSRYSSTLPGSSTVSQVQIGQMRTELDTLRTQVDSLRGRLGELECATLKLDERTLTPAARQRRRSAQAASEPCRANPDGPVTLSARPQ